MASGTPLRLRGRWAGRATVAGALIWAVSHPIVLAAWDRDATWAYALVLIGWALSVFGLGAFWARYGRRFNPLARVGFAITAASFALLPAVSFFVLLVAAALGVGALLLGLGLTAGGLSLLTARLLLAPLPLGALAYLIARDGQAVWGVSVLSLTFAAALAAIGEDLGARS